MQQALKINLLLAIFLGGAIGSTLRFLIELALPTFILTPLYLTAIVNLVGAFALGVVSKHSFFQTEIKKVFFGPGILGGFTTMSGLALISAGANLGLSENGLWFIGLVIFQLLLGVLLFALGSKFGKSK